ncbi:hypothetical protein ND748_24315, partial [Frankia sp. AiPs1]|uniref:hypothetical protein n=1 Tax=Frankia sp. AiPs1 TaxID=573493 RepID=UPI0020444CD6
MTTAPRVSPEASPAGSDAPDPLDARELVVVITPFAQPAAALVAAVTRAGGLGVLDLGRSARAARDALRDAARWTPGRFGVRVAAGCPVGPDELPDAVDLVVLAPRPGGATAGDLGAPVGPGTDRRWEPGELIRRGRRVWAEVTSVAQARGAVAAGAVGLVARGNESGGVVGDLTTFTLLQHLLAAE